MACFGGSKGREGRVAGRGASERGRELSELKRTREGGRVKRACAAVSSRVRRSVEGKEKGFWRLVDVEGKKEGGGERKGGD